MLPVVDDPVKKWLEDRIGVITFQKGEFPIVEFVNQGNVEMNSTIWSLYEAKAVVGDIIETVGVFARLEQEKIMVLKKYANKYDYNCDAVKFMSRIHCGENGDFSVKKFNDITDTVHFSEYVILREYSLDRRTGKVKFSRVAVRNDEKGTDFIFGPWGFEILAGK